MGFALAAAALAAPAAALPLARDGAAPVVESVVVRADGQAGEQNMEELISVKRGDLYSLMAVDRSVKQIYGTGLFSDVRVLRTGDARVALTFVLTHRLTVHTVAFRGGDELPQAKMKNGVDAIRPGTFFSEDKIDRAVAELGDVLSREGYFGAQVKASVERNLDASTADVIFEIGPVRRYAIARIAFEGTVLVPEKELRGRLREKAGAVYVPARFREDLQRLEAYYVGLGYQRAEIALVRESFDEAAGRVDLAVSVLPAEKITLVVRGADVPTSILAPVWEERIFEEWGLTEGEARILTFLRRRGYVFASLTSRIERLENEIRVIYDVTPGDRYRVDRLEFDGLAAFTPSRVREEVGISEKMPFFALVDGERLFEIPRAIEFFYQKNGFPDCRVELTLKSREKAATAIFVVSEGARRTVGRIELAGVALFAPDAVRSVMMSVEGGGYYPPDVRKDVERIEAFYLDKGVRGTTVTSEAREVEPGSFDVRIAIAEGRIVRVGRRRRHREQGDPQEDHPPGAPARARGRGVPRARPGDQAEAREPGDLLRGEGRRGRRLSRYGEPRHRRPRGGAELREPRGGPRDQERAALPGPLGERHQAPGDGRVHPERTSSAPPPRSASSASSASSKSGPWPRGNSRTSSGCPCRPSSTPGSRARTGRASGSTAAASA